MSQLTSIVDFAKKRYVECMSKDLSHYHTVEHVSKMLNMYEDRKHEFALTKTEEDMLKIAICYHDIVYVPGRMDNESESAKKLQMELAEKEVRPALIITLSNLILSTRMNLTFRPKSNLMKTIHTLDLAGFCDYQSLSDNFKKIVKESLDSGIRYPEMNILKFYEDILFAMNMGYQIDCFNESNNSQAFDNIQKFIKERQLF